MKRKSIRIMLIALLLLVSFCTGVVAANARPLISANIELNRKLLFNGVQKIMYNEKGEEVKMLSYQGTTYLPVRAIGNLMGLAVGWDGPNNTVVLGTPNVKQDFIETMKPYRNEMSYYVPSVNGQKKDIAGKTYDHWLELSGKAKLFYDLDGKYSKLTFKVYGDYSDSKDYCVSLGIDSYKDEDIYVGGSKVPQTYSINVTGMDQLIIYRNPYTTTEDTIYMFDMYIE